MTRPTSSETDGNNPIIPLVQALMRSSKITYLVLFAVIAFLVYQLLTVKKDTSSVEYDTALIQQQIKNVGKLVVTEGHFSEVMTYKDQKKYLGDLITFDKKALVIINADVTVSFDLSKVTYDIDAENKIVTIKSIPEEELKISPDIKYYDVEQSSFNEFTGNDYNKINKIAKENLAKKIEKSTLKSNAKNRLVSELSKILIVTNSMGWKLQYNGEIVQSDTTLQQNIKG
jgi:uncharacterized membrane protein